MRDVRSSVALRTALIYAVVGVVWILASDRVVNLEAAATGSPFSVADLELAKGILFVVVTAALLFVLLKRGLRQIGAAESDRLRMAAALEERERFFHAVFEHSMDGLCVLDDAGMMVDLNAAAVAILGVPKEQAVGRRFTDFIPAGTHPAAERNWELVVGSGELSGEATIARPGGRTVPVTFSIRHAILPGRNLVLMRDVEGQRGLEERLRHAQRMESLGRLAGGVAHDFNNILTAILGHTEILVDDQPVDSPLRADLEEVRTAALRASALTRQLLAFSRRQVLTPKVLDLSAVVRAVEPMLRRVIGEDVVLAITATNGLAVRADPSQIEQVVVNLVVNARDAMPRGGQLTIRVDREEVAVRVEAGSGEALLPGEYAVLSVSDTGSGIAPEVMEHIFEPFYTTKERGRGSGLGLSTVYGIVSQSGGVVRVGSELAVGSTFRIYLPLVTGRIDAAPAPVAQRPAQGDETILLVEDEDAVRALAYRALAARGFNVIQAATGPAALEVADRHAGQIHALVTDVVMPGMSGPQVAEALRRKRPLVKVVFVSGYAEDAMGQRGPADYGATFLAKPFSADALASAVRGALDSGPGAGAGPLTTPSATR